jgi:hypothetical protein
MSKCRVGSKVVQNSLRALANANGKRNLRAYRVSTETETFYFEWAKAAHSFASRRAQVEKTPIKVFENAGGEEYLLLATYQFEEKTSKSGLDDLNYVKMPNTFVAKGDNSVEAWAFALTHPEAVSTIRRSRSK